MTACNVVRMRVTSGQEEELIALNRDVDSAILKRMKQNGFRKGAVIRTGNRAYCFIGEWDSFDSIVNPAPT